MNKLKVGDKVAARKYNRIGSIYEITRVTATQAISGTTRFKREYGNDERIRKVGETYYDPSFWLLTPELESEMALRELRETVRATLDKFSVAELTTDQLNQILNLIKSF